MFQKLSRLINRPRYVIKETETLTVKLNTEDELIKSLRLQYWETTPPNVPDYIQSVFDNKQFFGDSIVMDDQFNSSKKYFRCHGFKASRPNVSDFLMIKMQSGKTMILEFVAVKGRGDPIDAFDAYVKFHHYL